MPATGGPSKRKKTDDSTYSEMTSLIGSSPKEQAKAVLSSYLASLPKAISLIGNSLSKRHFDFQLAIDQTHSRIDSLRSDGNTKFPRSIDFKFELKASDAIKDSQEFKTLAANSEANVQYCRRLLRANCRDVAELELDHQQTDMKLFFCEAIYLLATAFAKNNSSVDHTQLTYGTLIRCALCKEITLLQDEIRAREYSTQDTEMGDPEIDSELLRNSGFRSTTTTNGCYQEFYNHLVAANHLDLIWLSLVFASLLTIMFLLNLFSMNLSELPKFCFFPAMKPILPLLIRERRTEHSRLGPRVLLMLLLLSKLQLQPLLLI